MESVPAKYPYAESRAAQMLTEQLSLGAAERWMSTRKLAKLLKIKQPSVISHMANGRLAIPVDRAVPLAQALGMDARTFLAAVLDQRFPDVDWNLLSNAGEPLNDPHLEWLRPLSGVDASQLTAEQAHIIGEVARDRHPGERWIEPSEVPYVQELRRRTHQDDLGMTAQDWDDNRDTIDRFLK